MKPWMRRFYALSRGGYTFAFLDDAVAGLPLSSIFAGFLTTFFTQLVLGFLQLFLPDLGT